MKLVIENYNSILSSKSSYLAQAANSLGVETYLWGTGKSSFDVIDEQSPDVVICHHRSPNLSSLAQRLASTNIDLVIDTCGDQVYQGFFDFFSSNKIKCPFYLKYPEDNWNVSLEHLDMLPAADVFLSQELPKEYLFNVNSALIYITNPPQVEDSPCHLVRFWNQMDTTPDIVTNVFNFSPFYSMYNEVKLHGPFDFVSSQVFFDAMYRANKVTLVADKESELKLNSRLGFIFETCDDEDLGSNLKAQITNNHTCINRAKSLLNKLGVTL